MKRLLRFPKVHAGLVLATTLILAGCASAPAKPTTAIDAQANFADYKTFGFRTNPSDKNFEPMSLVESNIREAITTEMLAKGYTEVPAGGTADIVIDYDGARTEKVKSSPFRVGFGVGSYGSSGGASINTSTSGVKNVTEGSLVIHAVDSARNAEVWRSQISREIGAEPASEALVQSVVAEILREFPSNTSTP